MTRLRLLRGLALGVLASLAFGTSGALAKPLMEAGWSPAAAVAVRAGAAGILLLPIALLALRGRWGALRVAGWRILGMALVGVAGTQLLYFAAIRTIPVSTGLLIEYLAPLLLVAAVAVTSRRVPPVVVLLGSAAALAGLVLVIGPAGGGDQVGYVLAALAAVACAAYYVIAARPARGLPPVVLAASGLLGGAVSLALVGLTGLVPFSASAGDVAALGGVLPWWAPMLLLAVTTAVAYGASITAAQHLGSRLMSFVGMLEVVFAALFAWLVLGEALGPLQALGGVLILAGIALVRAERRKTEPVLDAAPALAAEPVG